MSRYVPGVLCRICEAGVKLGEKIVAIPIGVASMDQGGDLVVQGTILTPVVMHVECLDWARTEFKKIKA